MDLEPGEVFVEATIEHHDGRREPTVVACRFTDTGLLRSARLDWHPAGASITVRLWESP